jgi:hypothetical protein
VASSSEDEAYAAAYTGEAVVVQSAEQQTFLEQAEASSFDVVRASPEGNFTATSLQHIIRILRPGGMVVAQSSADFKTQFLYAGLQNTTNTGTEWTATKPSWEAGSSAAIRRKTSETKAKTSTWQLLDLSANVELEDEDDLLNDDVDVKQSTAKAMDDCGESGLPTRKACKNCTCGRAEMEEEDQANAAPPPSGCGSCGLGDAFRCSTCPFLGMGTFDINNKPPVPTRDDGDAVMLAL